MGVLVLRILFILLLAVPAVSADIIINEIMAKPQDESLNEWIELYNNGDGAVDVAGWKFGDANDNDTIEGGKYGNTGTIIAAKGYAILTDDNTRAYDNFNVSSQAVHLYVDDASLGNGLSNSGEALYLYDSSGNLVQQTSYGAAGTDMAWALKDGSLHEQAATAGYDNTGSSGSATQPSSCDWSVEIILNKSVFASDEFEWKMRASKVAGDATQLSSYAAIETAEGNITKSYTPWNAEDATSQKTSSSYSPNLQPGVYLLNANISTACQDSDISNNKATKLFTIKDETMQSSESTITVDHEISDKPYKFGDIVMAKVTVYRGDTQKYSVKAVITKDTRKASEETAIYVNNKFSTVTAEIPIKLHENCEKSLAAGNYELKVEGLDKEATAPITIENNCSKSRAEEKTIEVQKESSTLLLITAPNALAEGSFFNVTALLFRTGTPKNVSLWSYIQKGNKVYGKQQEVKAEVAEKPVSVVLNQNLTDVAAGDYKLTIAFLDAEKHEIDVPFSVARKEVETKISETPVKATQTEKQDQISGAVVANEPAEAPEVRIQEYNAHSKNKDIVLYGLVLVLGALSTYLIFKKKIT